MKKTLVFAAVTMLGLAALGATSPGGAGATQPDDEGQHKVWVCHVVEGRGELKNGYNLIEVDESAVATEGHLNHVTKDGRMDIIPAPGGAASTCNLPEMPERNPVTTEWVGGTPTCTVPSVEHTRTVTTYSYEWNTATSTWVETATVTPETQKLSLTADEIAACSPKQESLPPVVETPAVTPVVATPVVEVAPAVEVAGTTVAAAPMALPATGGETWTIFVVGLATLLAGAGLVKLSRHTA